MSYDELTSILASVEVDDDLVRCVFRCPHTGRSHTSAVVVQPGPDDSPGATLRQAAINAVLGVLSGAGKAPKQADLSEEQLREAVKRAFAAVRDYFEKGPQGWRHRAEEPQLLAFEEQLERAPVTQPFDRAVLAAMVLEIALADGHTAGAEEKLLQKYIDTLRSRVPVRWEKRLSLQDLSETSSGPSRDSMLMLAWAVALVDQGVEPRELERLELFARCLLIPRKRVDELREAAARHLREIAGTH